MADSPAVLRVVTLSLALAIVTTWASHSLADRWALDPWVADFQRQTIQGGPDIQDKPQFQNRVIFAAGQLGMSRVTGWSDLLSFRVLRFLSFWWMFLIGAAVARKTETVLALALILIVSFFHIAAVPYDAPDVIAFIVGPLLASRRQFWPMLGLAIVASANRESSVFLALVWWAHTKENKTAAAIGLAAVVTVMGLRYALGGPDAFVGPQAGPPTSMGWIPLGISMAVLASIHGRPFPRLMLACAAILGLSIAGGNIGEPRIYLPAAVLWLYGSDRGTP